MILRQSLVEQSPKSVLRVRWDDVNLSDKFPRKSEWAQKMEALRKLLTVQGEMINHCREGGGSERTDALRFTHSRRQ